MTSLLASGGGCCLIVSQWWWVWSPFECIMLSLLASGGCDQLVVGVVSLLGDGCGGLVYKKDGSGLIV